MAQFIDLDSIYRDRENYPSPASYQLSPPQVDTWFRSKTVNMTAPNPNTRPRAFLSTVNIRYLTLPYSDDLEDLPRIYINFRSTDYKDIRLISTIDGVLAEANFICEPRRIQNDSAGNPAWIHYDCRMEQTMRFTMGEPIIIQFLDLNGDPLPIVDTIPPLPADPTQQTFITLEVTPYIRDGDYNNPQIDPLS